MTQLTIQPKSNNRIPQNEAQLKAVQIRPKMNTGKRFFEQLNNQSVYQSDISDKTAGLENIDLTFNHGASVHEPTNEKLGGDKDLASKNSTDHAMHKPHSGQRLDTTACSTVSTASVDFESFSVLLQKANEATIEIALPNSPSMIATGLRQIAIAKPGDLSGHPGCHHVPGRAVILYQNRRSLRISPAVSL